MMWTEVLVKGMRETTAWGQDQRKTSNIYVISFITRNWKWSCPWSTGFSGLQNKIVTKTVSGEERVCVWRAVGGRTGLALLGTLKSLASPACVAEGARWWELGSKCNHGPDGTSWTLSSWNQKPLKWFEEWFPPSYLLYKTRALLCYAEWVIAYKGYCEMGEWSEPSWAFHWLSWSRWSPLFLCGLWFISAFSGGGSYFSGSPQTIGLQVN